HGSLLHVFDRSAASVTVQVRGTRTLKLRSTIRPVRTTLSLGENYPNPFPAQGVTRIPYALAQQGIARLAVYDMLGRRVRVLADGLHAAGGHTVRWDGTDTRGGTLPAGVYTVRLETAQNILSRTITISR
ncbi:MAG: FlgD immunoglobulin-like domain containing protein, partial [Bacteroidota bacterium]|nr:FlgD immunoglobulin-like domain containing protein [Bacteroidota bacterium]